MKLNLKPKDRWFFGIMGALFLAMCTWFGCEAMAQQTIISPEKQKLFNEKIFLRYKIEEANKSLEILKNRLIEIDAVLTYINGKEEQEKAIIEKAKKEAEKIQKEAKTNELLKKKEEADVKKVQATKGEEKKKDSDDKGQAKE